MQNHSSCPSITGELNPSHQLLTLPTASPFPAPASRTSLAEAHAQPGPPLPPRLPGADASPPAVLPGCQPRHGSSPPAPPWAELVDGALSRDHELLPFTRCAKKRSQTRGEGHDSAEELEPTRDPRCPGRDLRRTQLPLPGQEQTHLSLRRHSCRPSPFSPHVVRLPRWTRPLTSRSVAFPPSPPLPRGRASCLFAAPCGLSRSPVRTARLGNGRAGSCHGARSSGGRAQARVPEAGRGVQPRGALPAACLGLGAQAVLQLKVTHGISPTQGSPPFSRRRLAGSPRLSSASR